MKPLLYVHQARQRQQVAIPLSLTFRHTSICDDRSMSWHLVKQIDIDEFLIQQIHGKSKKWSLSIIGRVLYRGVGRESETSETFYCPV